MRENESSSQFWAVKLTIARAGSGEESRDEVKDAGKKAVFPTAEGYLRDFVNVPFHQLWGDGLVMNGALEKVSTELAFRF